MVFGIFMVILDTTVLNVALPTIMNVFSASLDQGQLVISMYLVALALVIPTTGYLSDRFGTKRVYALSIAGFTLGSVLSGLAWDMNSLIVFRVIQGLAGGITAPLSTALIFRNVAREEQGFMISLAGIPIMVAPVFGPVLSGFLVETPSWRWIFFINLPVGILGIFLTIQLLRETEKIETLPFDYKGFILAGIGFCTALFALTRVTQDGWTASNVLAMFFISGISLVAWVFVELREKSPLLDLRILRNVTYCQAASLYIITVTIMFTVLFLLPLFLQNLRGLTPMQTGLLLMPEAVAMAVALLLAGRLYNWLGPRPLIISGLIVVSYAMFRLNNLDLTTSDAELVRILILRGVGIGLMFLPAFTLALSVFSPSEVARAAALTMSVRQLFPAFATAAIVTILHARQAFHFSTLAQTVTPDSIAAMQVLSRLENAAGQFGVPEALSTQAAVQVLHGLVQRQAAVAAFNDVFLIIAIVALAALIPAAFLGKPKQQEAGQPVATAAAEPAD